MKKILGEQFIKMFNILVIAMAIGVLGGATFAVSEVSAAASSPIKVQYDGTTRHNMKIQVGKTTTKYLSYDLSGKGTINSAKWESSNTSIMTIASTTGKKGSLKCKFKGVKEGHAVLKLTVKTTKNKKNYTYTESVGISVFTDIENKYCFSYELPATFVYRGATTAQYEVGATIGSEKRNCAFFEILYQCGGYYYVEKKCEPVWQNGSIVRYITSGMKNIYEDNNVSGFVKKSSITTSVSSIVNGITIATSFENYPLNYSESLKLTTRPYDVPVTCKWSSSNTNVVTVTSTGIMKTVGSGEATITATLGKYSSKCKIRVVGLLSYDSKNRRNIVNDSPEAIKNELKKHPSYSSLLPTDNVPYDIAFDVRGDSCSVCNTKNRYFESFDMFNTNCYGFVLNRWGFNWNKGDGAGLTPGTISGNRDNEMLWYPEDIAELVKNDVECLGGDAEILKGKDNDPSYPTDENHYLIAIRTRGTYQRLLNDDDFHFMVRKNGGWYFKDGKTGDILKLRNNYNPDNIRWHAYYYNDGEEYTYHVKTCYTTKTQYMVISKLPMSIK